MLSWMRLTVMRLVITQRLMSDNELDEDCEVHQTDDDDDDD